MLAEFQDHANRVRMVKTLIMTCNRCELGKSANRVPYGGTSWRPKLILLGEAPGQREDRLGEPFVGPAGLLLDKILGMVGLRRDHVMIANTICCRPPQNRDPEWSEIEACGMNRRAQIYLGQTWVGVILGRVALGAILEDPGKAIGAYKGKPFWDKDMVWVPTYHPAYGLRNKGAISEIASHIKVALDIKEGRTEAPIPKESNYRMEGRALIVDHEAVRVPERVRELAQATFTKEEWMRLAYTSEEMKGQMLTLKTEFGGSVVR